MAVPVARRAAVRAMLDRDEAYDQDPKGDPPLSVARYRSALRAAIDVAPEQVAERGMPRSTPDAEAYSAGVRDALDVVVSAIALEVAVDDPGHQGPLGAGIPRTTL